MKRALCLCLCVVLLVSLFAFFPSSAVSKTYVAVNDEVLTSTPGGVSPNVVDHTMYIPLNVFTQYFSFRYSYDSLADTLTMTYGGRSIYFNRKLGLAVDDNRNYYSYIPYLSGGTFMVPAQFVCSFFGLSYSYIASGPVVRISGSSPSLTDTELMKKYSYIWNPDPVNPDDPNGGQNPSDPDDPSTGFEANKTVYLTFDNSLGEHTKELLSILAQHGLKATFFVTKEGIEQYPELVFQMIAEGHTVGLGGSNPGSADTYATAEALIADLDACAEALYKTCKFSARLVRIPHDAAVTQSRALRNQMTAAGYRVWGYTTDTANSASETAIYRNVTRGITDRQSPAVIRFGENLPAETLGRICVYLKQNGYRVLAATLTQTPLG